MPGANRDFATLKKGAPRPIHGAREAGGGKAAASSQPRPGGNKLMSLGEAIGLIREEDMVAIGGMTLHRKPMAFVRELARSGLTDLTLLAFTGAFEAEILAAAGALRTIRTCYMGLEYLGLAPALRRAVEDGSIEVVEETEYSMSIGLQAALMQVPYLPSRDSLIGTDYFAVRPDLRRAPCPVTGEMLTWFPALAPRVAVIHVPKADARGNAWLGGEYCIDAQLAMAAECTILTAEQIVSTEEIGDAQGGAGIISFMVDAVVETPGGAHPTSCFPDYQVDVVHIARYLRQMRQGRGTSLYLDRYVTGPPSLQAYLERILEDGVEPR